MFIVNECVYWFSKKNKKVNLFKFDFEKVYDLVRLDFIEYVMKIMGFGGKWI